MGMNPQNWRESNTNPQSYSPNRLPPMTWVKENANFTLPFNQLI